MIGMDDLNTILVHSNSQLLYTLAVSIINSIVNETY